MIQDIEKVEIGAWSLEAGTSGARNWPAGWRATDVHEDRVPRHDSRATQQTVQSTNHHWAVQCWGNCVAIAFGLFLVRLRSPLAPAWLPFDGLWALVAPFLPQVAPCLVPLWHRFRPKWRLVGFLGATFWHFLVAGDGKGHKECRYVDGSQYLEGDLQNIEPPPSQK